MRWLFPLLAAGLAAVLVTVLTVHTPLGPRLVGSPRADLVRPVDTGATATPATATPRPGTPADSFPVGAAGIVLPEPRAVPGGYRVDELGETRGMTAEQVADALAQVRATLIAARLGKPMLIDHDPEPFLDTLAPYYFEWSYPYRADQAWYIAPRLANHGTLLAPDTTLAATPRVAGQISFQESTNQWGTLQWHEPVWVLEIVARFVWVYEFEVAAGEAGDGIVVVRDESVWLVPGYFRSLFRQFEIYPTDRIHHGGGAARAWGADCDLYAATGQLRPAQAGSVGRLTDLVFDPDQPLEPTPGCRPGEPGGAGQAGRRATVRLAAESSPRVTVARRWSVRPPRAAATARPAAG